MTYYGLYCLRLDFCKKIRDELASVSSEDKLAAALDAILKELKRNPFEVVAPHWATIAFEPDRSIVIEKGEVKISELQSLYPEDEDWRSYVTSASMHENNSIYDVTVPYYHVETRDYIYDLVGRGADDVKMLQSRPNPIGRPWYVFAAGRLSPETAPLERYRPLLAPVYPVAEQIRILSTLINSAALQEGRTGYQLVENGRSGAANAFDWAAQPQNERPVLAFDLTSDALVNPPAGFHYENMPVPDRQILVEALQNAKRDMQDYGFPAPLSPDQALTGQASSGHLATREIEQANFSINPALSRLAAADKELCKLVGDIITALDLKVSIPVFQKGNKTKDAREVVTVTKQHFEDIDIALMLNGSTASMDYADKEADMRDMQAGALSLFEYMTKWREDPIRTMTFVDQEKLAIPLKEMVQQGVLAFVQSTLSTRINNSAAQLGVAIPPAPPQEMGAPPQPTDMQGVIPQAGGPAEPGGIRAARPETPMPGMGAPANPEVQSTAMEGMPV